MNGYIDAFWPYRSHALKYTYKKQRRNPRSEFRVNASAAMNWRKRKHKECMKEMGRGLTHEEE